MTSSIGKPHIIAIRSFDPMPNSTLKKLLSIFLVFYKGPKRPK
jgi:hypothetical protein